MQVVAMIGKLPWRAMRGPGRQEEARLPPKPMKALGKPTENISEVFSKPSRRPQPPDLGH